MISEEMEIHRESINGVQGSLDDKSENGDEEKIVSSPSIPNSLHMLDIETVSYSPLIRGLLEDLQSLDYERVSLAILHFPLLFPTIGPELTRLKLLPYISYILDSIDEQEVILGSLAHVFNLEIPNSITVEHIGGLSFITPAMVPLLGDLIFHSDSCSLVTEQVFPPSFIVR